MDDENKLENQLEKDCLLIIEDLKKEGVDLCNYQDKDPEGLGDLVEKVLKKFGITEDRVKAMTGLKDCGCDRRKEWLNKVFPFRKKENRK
jgi:hypothetical protein